MTPPCLKRSDVIAQAKIIEHILPVKGAGDATEITVMFL